MGLQAFLWAEKTQKCRLVQGSREKYTETGAPVITGLRRISKPGLRIYTSCEDMPKVLKGIGTAIVSTPKGVMTDKQARKENVGGEVLAFVW